MVFKYENAAGNLIFRCSHHRKNTNRNSVCSASAEVLSSGEIRMIAPHSCQGIGDPVVFHDRIDATDEVGTPSLSIVSSHVETKAQITPGSACCDFEQALMTSIRGLLYFSLL